MISREDLYLFISLEHDINNRIDILRLLRFLSNLRKDSVPTDTLPDLHLLLRLDILLAFIANQTDLIGMHEVISMRQVNLLVFQLHPNDLFHKLVAPLLHNLYGSIQLTIEDP